MVYGIAIVADPSSYPSDTFALPGVWGRRGDALRAVTLVWATELLAEVPGDGGATLLD